MKSQVLTLANKLTPVMGCRKAATVRAWQIIKMREQMKTGTVTFTYTKATGETRIAVGTLSSEILPAPQPGYQPRPLSIAITYFDIEKNGFRSFRADRFTGIAA